MVAVPYVVVVKFPYAMTGPREPYAAADASVFDVVVVGVIIGMLA